MSRIKKLWEILTHDPYKDMDITRDYTWDNVDRAKERVSKWPRWKREYKVTKYSGCEKSEESMGPEAYKYYVRRKKRESREYWIAVVSFSLLGIILVSVLNQL